MPSEEPSERTSSSPPPPPAKPEPEKEREKEKEPRRASKGPPKSATSFGLNCIALAIVLACMYWIRTGRIQFAGPPVSWGEAFSKLFHGHLVFSGPASDVGSREVLFMAGAVAVPVLLLDILVLKVHRRASTGLDWDRPFAFDLGRVLTKLLGLAVTIAPFALAYWTFPEYGMAEYVGGKGHTFYAPFYGLLQRFWLTLAVGVPLYVAIVDGQMKEPRDAYWQLGRVALGKWRDARKGDIANHYRGWLVKGFFFPFMFVWMNNSTHNVINYDLSLASWANLRAYDFLYDFIFFIDLIFCTVGYALSLRPVDTHIRTAEPTMLGWAVALFCYPPFYNLMERQYVSYGANTFGSWLAPHPTIRWAWAIGICVLITIYSLGTVAFGVRFSNLTHRGILTNGPYRFTKHPAYVTKNISWWMASVPFLFLDGNWGNAIKRCLCLGIINFMYFMRAKTEERHLSRDPVYVQYALWMNEHGVLRFLNRIPVFKYKPPPGYEAAAAQD